MLCNSFFSIVMKLLNISSSHGWVRRFLKWVGWGRDCLFMCMGGFIDGVGMGGLVD